MADEALDDIALFSVIRRLRNAAASGEGVRHHHITYFRWKYVI
jgi:hypothetical protein